MSDVSIESLPPKIRSKIEPVTESGCWIWTACCHPSGYGKTSINKKLLYAHRAVYEILIGEMPEGLTLDHLCRVRCCVNPSHLEPVTMKVNNLRGYSVSAVNARKTHCPFGHPLSGENLRQISRGDRECLACHKVRTAKWHEKNPRGYDKDYYEKNKARIRAYQNAYQARRMEEKRESLL